jgi:hypothetical protein
MDDEVSGVHPRHLGQGGEPPEGFEVEPGVGVDDAGEAT